nr:hypothetical protein [Candidatus Enterousia merdequi]
MKRIFLISLLGVFVSVAAMGGDRPTPTVPDAPVNPGGPTPEEPMPEEPKYVPFSGQMLDYYDSPQVGVLCMPYNDVYACCPSGQPWDWIGNANGFTCFNADAGCPSNSHFNNYPLGAALPDNGLWIASNLCECDSGYSATYNEGELICIESTPSAPRRVAIAANATNADCDSETLETNSGSTTLTAQWTANTITLKWYNGDKQYSTNTCTYDSGITLPSQPTKTGYNLPAGVFVKIKPP